MSLFTVINNSKSNQFCPYDLGVGSSFRAWAIFQKKEKWLSFPQQLSTANYSSTGIPPVHARILVGLILCKFWAGNHNCYEFQESAFWSRSCEINTLILQIPVCWRSKSKPSSTLLSHLPALFCFLRQCLMYPPALSSRVLGLQACTDTTHLCEKISVAFCISTVLSNDHHCPPPDCHGKQNSELIKQTPLPNPSHHMQTSILIPARFNFPFLVLLICKIIVIWFCVLFH